MTPTQRTLAECRRRGWTAAVVEKWNPHARIRQDLFGCIDIVAIEPGIRSVDSEGREHVIARGRMVGIQTCAGSSHSTRRAKALAEPRLKAWLSAGADFEVWSWSKRGPRGKRKTWVLREEEVRL